MTDMILITREELEHLREKKSVEVTNTDLEALIENKDLFIRWLSSEKLLYQVKLWNLEFIWNENEANYGIMCLKKTIERLNKIDQVVSDYNKQQEKNKKPIVDTI